MKALLVCLILLTALIGFAWPPMWLLTAGSVVACVHHPEDSK